MSMFILDPCLADLELRRAFNCMAGLVGGLVQHSICIDEETITKNALRVDPKKSMVLVEKS